MNKTKTKIICMYLPHSRVENKGVQYILFSLLKYSTEKKINYQLGIN